MTCVRPFWTRLVLSKVAAVQGNACFFSYSDANGRLDPLTLHSGNAVIDGDKWIAVKWLREGLFPQ